MYILLDVSSDTRSIRSMVDKMKEYMKDLYATEDDSLVVSVLPLAVKIAKTFAKHRELDDLIQVANLAVVQAQKTYDPEKSKFTTYVYRKIIWALLSYVKKNDTPQHCELEYYACDCNVRDDLIDLEDAVNKLTGKHYTVIRLRLDGLLLREIGEMLNLTKERIRQIELQAKAKLKEMLCA